MTFDFGLATGIRLALQDGARRARWRRALGDTITAWPANQQGSFLTNHDQTRIMSELVRRHAVGEARRVPAAHRARASRSSTTARRSA